MWEKSKGGICVFCRAKWYSNFPSSHPKKVAMHPIENSQIDEEDNQNDIEEQNNKKKKKKITKTIIFFNFNI